MSWGEMGSPSSYERLTRALLILLLILVLQAGYTYALTLLALGSGAVEVLRESYGTYDPASSAMEAAGITLLALLGATIMMIILLKGAFTLMRMLVLGSLFLSDFFALLMVIPVDILPEDWVFAVAGILALLIVYVQGIARSRWANTVGLMASSGLVGVMIGSMFTEIQISLLLVGLSLYDIYAVYRGPIRRIVTYPASISSKRDVLKGLFAQMDGISVGIGDFVMYSALISNSAIIGLRQLILTSLGVTLGAVLTVIVLLRRHKLVPGLPLPAMLGLLFLWLSFLY